MEREGEKTGKGGGNTKGERKTGEKLRNKKGGR